MRPSNLAIAYLLSLSAEGAHAQNNFPNRNRAPRRNLQGSFDDGRFKLPEDAGADPVATEGSMSVSFQAADLTTAEFDRFQVPTTAFPVDEMMSIQLIADDLGPTALPSASPITKFPSATPTGSPVIKGTKALKPAMFDLSSIGDGSMSLASVVSPTGSPTAAPTGSPTLKGSKTDKENNLTQFIVDTSSNGGAKMASSGKGSNDTKARTKAAKQPGGGGKESKESKPSEDEPSGKDSKSNDSIDPIFSKSAKRQRALRMLQEEGSVSMSMSTNSPTPPQMDFGRFDVPDSTEFLEVESSTTSTSAPVIAKSGKNRKKKRRNRRKKRRGSRILQSESLSLSLSFSFSYPDVDLTIADVVVEELITPEPTSSPTASPTSSPTAKADKQPTPNTSTKTLTQFMLTTSDNGAASGGGSPTAGKSGKTRRKMAQKGSVNKLRALQEGGSMSASMSLPSLMEEFPTIVESTTEGPTASPTSSPTSSLAPTGKAEKIKTASTETSSITQFAFTGGTGETGKGGARKGGSGKGGSGKGGSGKGGSEKGSRATDGTRAKSGKTQRLRRKQ